MSGSNLTQFDAALKTIYTDQAVQEMVYKDNPLVALMPKNESFFGRDMQIPLVFANPQGRSRSFARAQARAQSSGSKLKDFRLTRVHDYALATIDNETLLATKNDSGAFLSAATLEINGAINSLTRSAAIAQYKTGFGDVGTIGSIATNTITLSNAADITNFEVDQELEVAATVAGASRAFGSSGNGLIITGVDRSLGKLTFGFNVTDATNGVPAAVAGDTLFVRGDHEAGVLTKLSGLEAWIPATAPTSTLFFGVDRSSDVSRLGGQRQSSVGQPIEEALIDGASLVAREGGKLTHYMMGFGKYAELEKSLGSKVQYIDMKVTAEIAFRGIQIQGPKGTIRVVADQNCPSNRIFGLQMDTWKYNTLGKSVRVLDTDGLSMLRQSADDGVEVRYGYYGNISCNAPGYNINIQV